MSWTRTIVDVYVADLIDHTILGHKATKAMVEQKAKEAIKYKFASLCVPSTQVKTAYHLLERTSVKVCTVIGFPTGAHHTNVKALEIREAIREGAKELDVVVNVSQVLSGNLDAVKQEIIQLTTQVHQAGALVKWIFETSELNKTQIEFLCDACKEARADFVKTSTGFSSLGAQKEIVSLMKERLGESVKIKASGGIRDLLTLKAFYALGAERIGTSSGVSIMKEIV